MNRAHWWRRGDGAVLSCIDLTEAVPMMLDELHDIKRLVNLLEEWLLFEQDACYLLTDWLLASAIYTTNVPTACDIIDQLGTLGVKLYDLVQAGIPDTGHTHPPTP